MIREKIFLRLNLENKHDFIKHKSALIEQKSRLNQLTSFIRFGEFLNFKEALKSAKEHAKKFGLIKSYLFEYEICELEASVRLKDFSNALEKVEILIPQAKEYGKVKKTFKLHVLKAEILVKMGRFQEAMILINNLFRNSESFGKMVKAELLYLMTLAKLGLLQGVKAKERIKEKENKTMTLQMEDDEEENLKKCKLSVKSIIKNDFLKMKEELRLSARLFLEEMHIVEANQCMYLLARLENVKEKREMVGRIYVKVKKVQHFCKRKVELLSSCYNNGAEFFKFILRIRRILQEISKEI